jgi:high-affinity iron transporter
MRRPLRVFLGVVVLLLLFTLPAAAQDPSPADHLRGLIHPAEEGIEAAEQNKPELMRAEYDEIHTLWESFEDQVREADPQGYVELETALDAIKDAVNAQPIDAAAVKAAYEQLEREADEVATRLGTASTTTAPADVTLLEAMTLLDAAASAIDQGDVSTATTQFDAFIRAWPVVEGTVATKSSDAYEAIEGEMGRVRAALTAQPADLTAAKTAIERMRAELAPFSVEQTYTWFDAAAIILREGLEALLVVVALLAFLRKSGNVDKRGWIWAGSALGVLASIVTAFILQAIFNSVSAGASGLALPAYSGSESSYERGRRDHMIGAGSLLRRR